MALSVLCIPLARGEEAAGTAGLAAVAVSPAPVVDGRLDDPAWQQAPATEAFYDLQSGQPASEATRAWIGYDDTHVYVAFEARDTQPGGIVARQKKRGGSLETDDWVGVELDTFFNRRDFAFFQVSAGGTQTETVPWTFPVKIEWVGDWHAAVQRTETGWTAEIAIPWSILRYNAGQSQMGVGFVRNHHRTRVTWYAPYAGKQQFDPSALLVWGPLTPPRVRERALLLPYVLGETREGTTTADAGLDVKYLVTPSLAGVLTLNPDFRGIEQDIETIDFSYTDRFFPDRRPFFSEGNNYMPTVWVFDPLTIGAVDGGVKLVGTLGPDWELGTLYVKEDDGPSHIAFNLAHIFSSARDRGALNFTLVDRNGAGNPNDAVWGGGGFWDRQATQGVYEASALYFTSDFGDTQGHLLATGYGLIPEQGRLGWNVSWYESTPDFIALDGFLAFPDARGPSMLINWADRNPARRFRDHSFAVTAVDWKREDGTIAARYVQAEYDLESAGGVLVGAGYLGFTRDDFGVRFDDHLVTGRFGWGRADRSRTGGLTVNVGDRAGGNYFFARLAQNYPLTANWQVAASAEFTDTDSPFIGPGTFFQHVLSTTYDVSPWQSWSARLIVRDAGTNVSVSYRKAVAHGTDLFILYGDPNALTTVNRVLAKALLAFRW